MQDTDDLPCPCPDEGNSTMPDNQVTLIGNLTDDPELRFTQGGHAVCSFRLAVTRWQGKDKEPATDFFPVNMWRDLADNVAESLKKGQRVICIGDMRTRSYENKDGQTVWVTELEAQEVGPSLRWAQAKVERADRKDKQTTKKEDVDVPF